MREISLALRAGLRYIYKAALALFPAVRRQLSITPARCETLAFLRKSRDSPLRRASGCMGGDISAVVSSASRLPRTSPSLVNVSSRAAR